MYQQELLTVCAEVGGGALNLVHSLGRLVHRALLMELRLVLREHLLLVLAGDDRGSGRGVHLWLDLVGLDGLHAVLRKSVSFRGSVLKTDLVVVDVTLAVDRLRGLHALLLANILLDDLRGHLGADLGRVRLVRALELITSAQPTHCQAIHARNP